MSIKIMNSNTFSYRIAKTPNNAFMVQCASKGSDAWMNLGDPYPTVLAAVALMARNIEQDNSRTVEEIIDIPEEYFKNSIK